jgi:hypothetical protein
VLPARSLHTIPEAGQCKTRASSECRVSGPIRVHNQSLFRFTIKPSEFWFLSSLMGFRSLPARVQPGLRDSTIILYIRCGTSWHLPYSNVQSCCLSKRRGASKNEGAHRCWMEPTYSSVPGTVTTPEYRHVTLIRQTLSTSDPTRSV